jgi:hypothetical protein
VLNYIDANGKHHTLEGVPERKFNHNVEKLIASSSEERQPDGTSNTESPFRRQKAHQDRGIGAEALDKPQARLSSYIGSSASLCILRTGASHKLRLYD